MKAGVLLSSFLALGLAAGQGLTASAERYANQTPEERPHKKPKPKGFDYDKSEYISRGQDVGGHYLYKEGLPVVAVKAKRKKGRSHPRRRASEDSDSASLAEKQPQEPKKKLQIINMRGSERSHKAGIYGAQQPPAQTGGTSQSGGAGQPGGQRPNVKIMP